MSAETSFDLALQTAQRMLMVASRSTALERAAHNREAQTGREQADFWARVEEYLHVLPSSSQRLNGFGGQRLDPCSKCGRSFTQAEWDALPEASGGSHLVLPPYPPENDPGEVLEMRNCYCHSTLTALEPFTGADVGAEIKVVRREKPGINLKDAQAIAVGRLKKRYG